MKDRIKFKNKEYIIVRSIVDEKYGNILKCVSYTENSFEKVYLTKMIDGEGPYIDIIKDEIILEYLENKYDYVVTDETVVD